MASTWRAHRSISMQRMQKALNVTVKEEKTEITVMMGMQNSLAIAAEAGRPPPMEAIMATAAAEQPTRAKRLHHLLAYVQSCGGNGELLKDLDSFTKVATPRHAGL